MAPRVLPLPRQQSFSPPTVPNPFVHPGRLSASDKLRVRLRGGRERPPGPGRAAPGWDVQGERRARRPRARLSPGAALNQRSEPRSGPPWGCQRWAWRALVPSEPPWQGRARCERSVFENAAGTRGCGARPAQRRPCPAPPVPRARRAAEQPRLWFPSTAPGFAGNRLLVRTLPSPVRHSLLPDPIYRADTRGSYVNGQRCRGWSA